MENLTYDVWIGDLKAAADFSDKAIAKSWARGARFVLDNVRFCEHFEVRIDTVKYDVDWKPTVIKTEVV